MRFIVVNLIILNALFININIGEAFTLNSQKGLSLPDFKVKSYIAPNENNYFFIAPYNIKFDFYLEIIDLHGTPVYIRELPNSGYDFKIQENGFLTYFSVDKKRFYMVDSSFQALDSFYVTNDYETNFHDIKVLKNGHVILIGNKYSTIDMSVIVPGGSENATVIDAIIQEFDENKNLIFEWNSRDHYDFTDSYGILDSQYIDYAHINSLEIDKDGNLILSACYLSEVTKIDRITGDILWRFGGKNNEFTFINDTVGFSYQHSVLRLDNGNICMFDNAKTSELEYSRGLIYELDTENKTANLIHEYKHTDNTFSNVMGNIQLLTNENVLIGWGDNVDGKILTEFDSLGTPILDITSTNEFKNYRAFSFPWHTNKFQSNTDSVHFDTIEYGNDSTILITIYNNSKESIELSSFTTLTSVFQITDNFPITINSEDHINLNVRFKPDELGNNYSDVLTLNSDSYNKDGLFERIAIQVRLFGFSPDISPPKLTFAPQNNSENIELDSTIYVESNEPLRLVDDFDISISDLYNIFDLRKDGIEGKKINYVASISENKKEINLIPEYLESNSTYFLLIDDNLEDYSDNKIEKTNISFKTKSLTFINEVNKGNIQVYPNPTKDKLKVEFVKEPKVLKIIKMAGDVIYVDNKLGEFNNYQIDLSGQPTGMYLIHVLFKDGSTSSLKFIKNE